MPGSANVGLVPIVDYVKMDLPSVPDIPAWIRQVNTERSGSPAALVAERVETMADYTRARDAGMTHFQGFFFGKPATQRTRRIPEAQLGYLRLMRAMRNPDLTVLQIEELIKPDAALCFRLLRTVNSAAFGLRTEVGSIREALILLGRDPVKRWVSLWAMVALSSGSHSELMLSSLVRARMCELLGQTTGDPARGEEGYLLGMCSLLDAIFDAPMDAIVAQLPLDASLRAALLGDDNPHRRMLEAVIAYERGDWQAWQPLAESAGLSLKSFATAAADALRWSNEACAHGALDASA
jgi:EAL and modified HD-GYP domain-containing signal transduction protein